MLHFYHWLKFSSVGLRESVADCKRKTAAYPLDVRVLNVMPQRVSPKALGRWNESSKDNKPQWWNTGSLELHFQRDDVVAALINETHIALPGRGVDVTLHN